MKKSTHKRLTAWLLTLALVVTLLPGMGMTALAAGSYPAANVVFVDGGKNFYNPGRLYYKNGDSDASFTGTATDYNAAYDPDTGILTLQNYNGGSITAGGNKESKITVVLVGDNFINDGNLNSPYGGDITVTSGSSGTLSITQTMTSSGNAAIGIEAGYGNYKTGNVTITGSADVKIKVTHNGTNGHEDAYGIYAKENITISENASVDITCATPNNTYSNIYCNGLRADKNVTVNTDGTIKIDVTTAGADSTQSFGIYPMGNSILTKVKEMEVWWKSHDTNPSYPGGAIKGGLSFDTNTHAVNEDTTNCYASYRYGEPRTVTVENGTVTGTGVPNAKDSGKFLENDTVNIKPYEPTGKSGEKIPFKGWTSSDVTLTSPTTASNSFTVPGKDVTVTAMHNPFDGAPTFTPTGSTGTDGTLTFKTLVKPDDGNEYFRLVKEADKDDESKYNTVLNPNNSPTASPYEYSYNTTRLHGTNQVEAGNYYVAERLNGAWYLSEKFTVNYTAPTADISLDTTGPVNFGEVEKGYTTAPAAKTVTITNNGTAATGALTIALDGTHASSFKLSKDNISDIAAGGNATFTVQPKTGLPAGTYTATVKVSGDNVNTLSINMKFTVKDPNASATVSGTIKSYGSASEAVTVTLTKQGETSPAFTDTLTGASGSVPYSQTYSFSAVPAGTYTLKVEKKGHAPWTEEITVGSTAIVKDVTVYLWGDVNRDGKVTAADAQEIQRNAAKLSSAYDTEPNKSYWLLRADVNRDGKVTAADAQEIQRNAAKLSSAIDSLL